MVFLSYILYIASLIVSLHTYKITKRTQSMNPSEFFRKFTSRHLLGNMAAMALVVVVLCAGVKYGLDIYTHHGESIAIPDVRRKSFSDAQYLLDQSHLQVVVSDTGYVPGLPPDCVLEQTPAPGEHVKSGHIIYVSGNG